MTDARLLRVFSLLLAPMTAAVVGCAGDVSAPASNPGGPGSGGSTGAGGTGGVQAACHVEITPQSPTSFDGLTAGPGAKLRVRGEVTGLPSASFTWAWDVAFADGSAVTHVQPPSSDASVIEFSMALPGTYTVTVELAGSARFCGGERTVVAQRPGAKLTSFRFRFVPPADSDPPQEREIQIAGGTPSGGNHLVLLPGTLVPFDPRDQAGGAPLPAYVRVTDGAHRIVAEAHVGSNGQAANLRLMSGAFDMLVIPDGDYAPVLLAGRQASELAAQMPMMIDKGMALSGQVVDASGPVSNAKVVMRAGTLPSTLAVTGPTGAFTVRVAPGSTYGMTITRGDEAGRTIEAVMPATPGITVGAVGPQPALDVRMSAFSTAGLSLNLMASETGSLSASARVLVETAASLEGLVTLTMGTITRPAVLKVRGEVAPKADGSVALVGLPRARYKATVFPGALNSFDAVTTIADLDLTAGNLAARTVMLKRKVTLTGKLLPGAQAGGLPITAVDLLGDFPIAVPGSANDAGIWSLRVNPERTYSLRVQPQPGRMLARTNFGPVPVLATDTAVADQRMPPALLYAGTVMDHSVQGIDRALIQVFCIASSPDCADTETPIAETVTVSDGSFQLLLPDPGVN
ncbi:MAG TPA: carboxypeptidase-like regulatory domain-containing protein [Polyangia bacterium]|nr:carboxypeptidase-like regulatory domain-containing protein [Polyangia bacterium]